MNPDDWDFYCGGGCLDDDDWNSGDSDAAADGFYPDDDVSDTFDPVLDNHLDDDERIITPFDMGSDAIGDADAEFDLNQEPHGINDDDEFDLNQDTNVIEDAEFDLDDPRGDGDFEYAISGVEIHEGEVEDDVEDVDEGEFFTTVRVRESSSSVDRVRNETDVFDTVFPARRRLGLGLFIDDDDDSNDVDDDVDRVRVRARNSPDRVRDSSSSVDREINGTDVFDTVFRDHMRGVLLIDDDIDDVDDGVDRVRARDSPDRVRDSSSSVDREMNGTDVFDTVFHDHRRGVLLIDDDIDDVDEGVGGEFASGTMRLGTWSDDDYEYDDDVLLPGPRLFRVYADEWDGGMVRRRAVGDDVGEGVSGVAWEGEDGWGDAHWQGEEDVGVVTSSSRAEVTGVEDNAVVVSASGVECKGVEGVDSGIDGLSCPICMDPLSREGEHIACCLPCGHLYGVSCIKTWLQQRAMGKCPQCNKNCTFMDVRRLYLPQITVANEEMQEKIMILEAKCASLELKDAEWSKKEAEWNQKEAELRNQLNQQKEAGLDEIVG
ncbi:hypothetical protein Drorol1_Dr00013878 [Drosera rotundifolia]